MGEVRIFGYARVSSAGQNLDRQIDALKQYVPEENIVVDKISGKSLDRPGYQALKGALGLRRGDILYVSSLDRLSRSKADIKYELVWFREKGISLRVLDLPTTMIEYPTDQEWIRDMTNNILIEVLSSMAEIERVRIKQRQREGIEAARRRGKHLGRPKKGLPENWDYYYTQYRKGIFTRKYVMDELRINSDRFKYLLKKQKEISSGEITP